MEGRTQRILKRETCQLKYHFRCLLIPLTLFYMRGLWYIPSWLFIVCRSSVGAPNRLIFYEFVPCNIRTVLDRSFLKFFFENIKNFRVDKFFQNRSKGGTLLYKNQKNKKTHFFLLQIIFFST